MRIGCARDTEFITLMSFGNAFSYKYQNTSSGRMDGKIQEKYDRNASMYFCEILMSYARGEDARCTQVYFNLIVKKLLIQIADLHT